MLHGFARRGLMALAAGSLAVALAACSSSSNADNPTVTGASKPAAASQTFHHISKADYHQLRIVLPTMRGVEGITYQGRNLSVQFRDTAVKLDQTNVANIVQTVQGGGRPAGPTPSKSAKQHHKQHA